MIRLLLIILISLLLMFFGYSLLWPDKPVVIPGSEGTQYTGPADAISGARGAVDKTRNLQDQLNQKAQDQLNQ